MPALARKTQGELAEILFLHEAASRGLVVARPWGDNLPFDFVVGTRLGRFHRVQVKSTTKRHYRGYRVMCLRAAGRKRYHPSDIDFLAAYVVPERTWYVVPVRAFAPRTAIVVFPTLPPRRRYERYREAWQLLEGVPSTRRQVPGSFSRKRRKARR